MFVFTFKHVFHVILKELQYVNVHCNETMHRCCKTDQGSFLFYENHSAKNNINMLEILLTRF